MPRFLLCALFISAIILTCNTFTNGIEAIKTIYVGKSQSIQAAINSVPSNNKNWICISVSAGVYKEKVVIPANKPFIYLKGAGKDKTSVVWSDSSGTIFQMTTFSSIADNILVQGITFVNGYNYPPSKNMNPVKVAVAARISGDQSAFYSCGFSGYQDTLLDDKGKHYFKYCTIEGAVDFIFGNGQSIYEKCNILLNVGIPNPASTGYITAQARKNKYETGGFVFKMCNVYGKGHAFLGRAWYPYSRVIFYASSLSNVIVPEGWQLWSRDEPKSTITFAEERCKGAGSNKPKRVAWEKTLTRKEFKYFTSLSYIDNVGWIRRLPVRI
ncbi:probable pectinesterase 29 [Salvia hispanica]|uniref:probable pectinesterase 29 n=1 Tax=Salvia hispanica TaxID=49212 RepID=UPI00200989AB|nr:probable pectinesterase 29 [Salvia hispanica]